MKKSISFIIILVLLFFCYFSILNKAKDYELEYKINSYTIKESYSKKYKSYYINIYNDDTDYSFSSSKKYSSKRNIVKNIDVKENNGVTCIKPIVESMNFDYICNKNNEYFVEKYDVLNKTNSKKIDSFEVFDENHGYYVWDGYGIKNVVTKKEIHFLDKEHFDNSLSFKGDNFMLFADYDGLYSFKKFYYVDIKKNEVSEIVSSYDISFDSYFLGIYKNKIYLFDRKNMQEYSIDIKKKVISIVSKKELGVYFDGSLKDIAISKLKYENLYFDYKSRVNYSIENNKLYMYYKNSHDKILLTNLSVKSIISYDDEYIYYLSDDSVYLYNSNGNTLLVSNFDWKFNYLNRIFIF